MMGRYDEFVVELNHFKISAVLHCKLLNTFLME